MSEEQLLISRNYLNSLNPKRQVSCITDRIIKKSSYDLAAIIPCYNAESYVKKAIESVLNSNSDHKICIIAVDDGSADNTGSILDEYGELQDIIIVHQQNSGAATARNTGLMYADAQYICFVDSDDYMVSGALDLMLVEAKRCNADILQGKIRHFNTDIADEEKIPSNAKATKIDISKIEGFPVAKIYRSELFDNICFPDSYWFEDGIIAYLIAQRAKSFYSLDTVVYNYRQNSQGATRKSQGNAKAIDAYWLREILFDDMSQIGLDINLRTYEMLLDEIALTYVRTLSLDTNAKIAIFYLTLEWAQKLHNNFVSTNKFHAILEKAIELENYNTYCDGCAIIWNSKIS